MSIGSEDSKGNELTLEAFRLCKKLDLNFIGNVEGHDLFKDRVDVVVCDTTGLALGDPGVRVVDVTLGRAGGLAHDPVKLASALSDLLG